MFGLGDDGEETHHRDYSTHSHSMRLTTKDLSEIEDATDTFEDTIVASFTSS